MSVISNSEGQQGLQMLTSSRTQASEAKEGEKRSGKESGDQNRSRLARVVGDSSAEASDRIGRDGTIVVVVFFVCVCHDVDCGVVIEDDEQSEKMKSCYKMFWCWCVMECCGPGIFYSAYESMHVQNVPWKREEAGQKMSMSSRRGEKALSISVPCDSTASLKLHIMFVFSGFITFSIVFCFDVRKSFFPLVGQLLLLWFATTKSGEEPDTTHEKVARSVHDGGVLLL
jgi:hypothetical protein